MTQLANTLSKNRAVRLFKILLLFTAALSLGGCMTAKKMNAIMDSWMGSNVNDLIASWGPPNGVMSDGKGGQILIYDQSGQMTLPGTATTTANYSGYTTARYTGYGTATANTYGTAGATTTYMPPTTVQINRKRMFWADSYGKLYRWSWRGL